jgi:membrane dipeptidase
MFIADTHCDTLFSMGVHGVPAERLMVTPERIRSGGVSLQTLALWTGPKGGRADVAGIVRKELDALPALLAGGLRRVDDPSEAVGSPVPCVMLSVEGGEVFEDGPDSVDRYQALGVRMAALLWNHENALGYPAKSGSSHGLKPYGLETVRRMQAAGMAVDTSHLNEAGFWDILEKTDVPPLASHSCCKALCGHCRNLSDEQLKALFAAGGYVGLNFYPWFLSDDGKCTMDTLCDHVIHMLELGGDGRIGFGSDFDGIEEKVPGLESPLDVPALIAALERRGVTGDILEGIAGKNLLRYYDRFDPKH